MSNQQQMAEAPPSAQQMVLLVQSLQVQCPPALGLEPLAGLESVWIHQQRDLLQPDEIKNKYQITDHRGTQCYMAFEQSNVAKRYLGLSRPLKMYIVDNYGRVVFYCEKPFKFTEDRITVHLHDGTILGSILITCASRCNREFEVFDQNSSKIFIIAGPGCSCCCANLSGRLSKNHDVVDVKSKKPVAQIRKEVSGFLKEITTDADIYGVEFFIGLDAKIKALLIGAIFLIDLTYYDKK